jgi:hypothetical protein
MDVKALFTLNDRSVAAYAVALLPCNGDSRLEIAFLRELINEHPELSRYALSKKVCEAWQWKQANGELRDMVCRGLLLMLYRRA